MNIFYYHFQVMLNLCQFTFSAKLALENMLIVLMLCADAAAWITFLYTVLVMPSIIRNLCDSQSSGLSPVWSSLEQEADDIWFTIKH